MLTEKQAKTVALGATLFATVFVTTVATKGIIRRKCRKQVKDKCMELPVIGTEEFCATQADTVCKV
jgi:hypothetical protein